MRANASLKAFGKDSLFPADLKSGGCRSEACILVPHGSLSMSQDGLTDQRDIKGTTPGDKAEAPGFTS